MRRLDRIQWAGLALFLASANSLFVIGYGVPDMDILARLWATLSGVVWAVSGFALGRAASAHGPPRGVAKDKLEQQ